MVRDLHRCHEAMGDGVKRVYESEVTPIMKMGKKLVAARNLPAGHVIKTHDIAIKSPGDGLPPFEIDKVVGRMLLNELKMDDAINFEVLNGAEYKMAANG
jgi:N-acetylneuraminate synthase/sialic acid synthase